MGQTPADGPFGQCAVALGFLTEAQVRECLDIQAKMREMGIDEPLGEILVKKRYLSATQQQQVFKKLGILAHPIPGYTLHGKIGQGGMGVVYKATQTSVNRPVAIKVLAAGATSDPAFVARFFQEARAAGKLSHKNLIAAIDVGEASGLYYFVMEFVTGRSCRECLAADGPFPPPRALDLAAQMAEVLDYIHQNRLVHRDVKPENILLTPDGVVKLCDLGLAKSTVQAEQSLTRTGFAVGTPYFMSPEQCRGDRDIDIRADLYSLGATLYFLATGQLPYEGKSAIETMNLHLKAPVPDPRKVAPSLPEDLARLIQTLMAKDREDRYATPAELLEDVRKIQSGAAPARARQQAARAHAAHRSHSTVRAVVKRRSSPVPRIAGLAAAAVVLVAIAFFFGGKPPPPPESAVRPTVPLPPPKTEAPVDTTPPSLVRAREAGAKDPNDLGRLVPLYEKAAADTRGTPFGDEARRVLAGLYRRDFDEVDVRTREAAQREEFGGALAILEAGRGRRSAPEWTSMVDARIAELRAQAERLFAGLKDAAVAARKRGAADEVDRMLDRVARWGLAELRRDLERSLSSVEPVRTAPAVDPAAAAWVKAAALAGHRDYAAAAAVEGLAAEDVELLRGAGAVLAEALQTLAKTPKGQKLALEYHGESGVLQRIEEAVQRADAYRIEFRRDEATDVVPLGELTADTLAEVWRTKSPRKAWKDGRAAALLCLLEGDAAGARKHGELPPRYGAPARKAEGPRDQEARKAYYDAERAYADPEETAGALLRFRALLSDFAETGFVRRNRGAITARTEGGREFLFTADDLRTAGTFRPAAATVKTPACWTSEADVEAARRAENYVEAGFSVLGGVEYRAWAYVGGCCQETLAFQLQAVDAADPSGAAPQAVKHSLSVTKTHASHGGVKQSTRWGWVALPLPKYGDTGARRLRVLTDQKGFSVAWICISAARTAAPREAELKEIEKAAGAPKPAIDPALLGWWRLDERAGTIAADATRNRNHGTLKNGPLWAAGKSGGGLSLDGKDDAVRVPASPSIESLGLQVTAAAWVLLAAEREDYRLVLSRQLGTGDENQFWLGFRDDRYGFSITTSKGTANVLGREAPTGEWIHLAGTYDGASLKLFVNGVEVASETHSGVLSAGGRAVTLGGDEYDEQGSIQEVPRGTIDEVRLYNRALTASEIAALAGLRR